MASEQGTQQEIKKLAGVLSATAKLADDASLKGSFSGGERRCILQYNAVLNRLQEIEAAPEGFFRALNQEASFGEIGVACTQLSAYLKNELNIVDFLEATARLAERATRRGSHRGGEKWCIPQYNTLLNWLQKRGTVPEGLFPPLAEDASFSEVGIAYSQLAAYLRDDEEVESDDLFHNLKDVGDIIRHAMPDFFKKGWEDAWGTAEKWRDKPSEAKSETSTSQNINVEDASEAQSETTANPETEEDASEAQSEASASQEDKPPEPHLNEVEQQIAELGQEIQALAEELREGGLSPEDIQRLTDEMRKLASRQAELAR